MAGEENDPRKVTAGTSSQIADGASWVILASEDVVKRPGLTPRAPIVDSQWSALYPSIMGPGPTYAQPKSWNARR